MAYRLTFGKDRLKLEKILFIYLFTVGIDVSQS